MSEVKKTAQDYRKELKNLYEKIDALKVRIAERLHSLCERFPDADIGIQYGHFESATIMKAKTIGGMIFISRISIEERLEYIQAIEKWITEQNPVKQGKLFN
jgi:hypothetical protein